MSAFVQGRLANHEDTSSFHAGLLKREAEGKAEFTPFKRDVGSSLQVIRNANLASRLYPEVRMFRYSNSPTQSLLAALMGGATDTTGVTIQTLVLSMIGRLQQTSHLRA
jgi:hypothetical protein